MIITGTNSANVISGTAGADVISAGNGNDTINGLAGNDLIDAGNGNDTVDGGAGNDVIDAGNGDDAVSGGAGNDLIDAGNGNDTVTGGAGSDAIFGGNGNDILIYRASENIGDIDIYDGGKGQDTLRLIVSQSMAASSAFQEDILALQAKLGGGSASYSFDSFDLFVSGIERVEVIVEAGANHAPVAGADTVSTNEDTTLTILASALLANDTDADSGDTKTLVSVQGAQHGTVSLNASGNVVFTADADFSGVASFTYTMRDSAGATSTATVMVNVAAVNDAPTATALSAPETYTEDTPLNLTDIMASDVDSPSVTVTLTLADPAAGALSAATSGSVTSTYNAATGVWLASGATADVNALLAGVMFMPAANFNGNFTVATSVTDGVAPAVTGSKTFIGTAVNDAPTAKALSAPETYTEEMPLNLTDIVVSDVDSPNVTVTLTLSDPTAGALSATTSGSVTSTYNAATGVWSASGATADVNALLAGVTFMPAANFNGNFTVATSVSDGVAPAVTGSKTFTGTAVNDAPIAVADALAATEDNQITYTKAQLLGNDTDVDNTNAQLSIASVESGTGGTAVLNSDGSVTFTPNDDFNGQAIFSYTVTDGALTSSPATVTVNVAPVASEPAITTERVEINASSAPIILNIQIRGFDASDTPSSTVLIGGVPDTYKLNHGAPAAEGDGLWIVNTSDLGDLALSPAVDGSVGAAQTITLIITASSFDHGSVASTTEELNILVKDPNVFRAVDGYIADALVFVDVNFNGLNDDGISTYTGPDGSFSLDTSAGPVILQGVQEGLGGHNTFDVLTGLPFTGTLKAPSGSTVVTPLTTLVVAIAGPSGDTAAAEASVKTALGLSSTVDLTTLDPIAGTVSDAPGAAEVLAASIQVQATVTQLSAATGASSDAVVDVLAQVVTSSTGTGSVDLGQSSTVTVLATAVNDTLPPEGQLSQTDLTAVTAVVFESNAQISSGVTGGADLSQVAQAAQVAFGSTTQALSDASSGGTTFNDVQSNYTGAALEEKIAAAPLRLTGTEVADTLTGGEGNDTISGLGGSDTLRGGGGNDTLSGGAGKDHLTGGAGDDTIDGGADFDRAIYTDATGGITANLGAGTVNGADVGSDTLIAVDAVVGSNYNDHFDSTGFTGTTGLPGAIIGFAEFEGGGGDDVIIGARNVQGHALTRVSYLGASAAVTVDVRDGQAFGTDPGDVANVGHDTISNILIVAGSNYDDTLGGSDNGFGSFEAYEGRRGNDFIDGRGGYDLAIYSNDLTTSTGITVNLAAGTVTGDSTVGTDTLRNVEAVRGTNFDDVFSATNFGAVGNPNIGSLGSFNDFQGGGGNDTVIGNGATRVNFSSALSGVTVNLQTNLSQPGVTATNVAGTSSSVTEGTDALTGVNAAQGSSFSDTLLGSNFNNNLIGLGDDDYIDGRGGFDTAVYNSMTLATGGVSVMMTAGTATDNVNNVIGHDTLKSIEGVQGTHFSDSYNAVNYGGAGFLDANLYNVGNNGTFNQFEGLGGDDSITGNNNTRLLYTNATAGVTVDFTGSFSGTAVGADASVGIDTFTGVNSITGSGWSDSITGDNNNNTFDGGAGDDTINGSGGSDTITGGAGNDIINGGTGTDMAVYSAAFGSYTLSVTSPGTGTISGPDGSDSFSNVEILQFGNRYQMVAAGTGAGANSINANGLGFAGNTNTFFGTTSDDFLTIGQNLGGHLIDLQGGNDTIFLGVTGGYSLALANVENLVGTGGDDFVGLSTNVNGLAIDLGTGSNDNVNLANGANTVSAVNVDNLNGSDFNEGVISNDTLTLNNNVSGLTVNLANGNNTLNLAAGGGSFNNIFNVQHINGTSSNDVLTVANGLFEPGNNPIIDLGGGDNTLNLGTGAATFSALNVQHLNGNALDNFFTLTNNINGMAVDLGDGGNDNLTLANGANSLSVTNVESIGSADWTGAASNDTLTLLNNVNGVTINLQQGFNTLNLAAGTNTFNGLYNVDTVNGTDQNDTLTTNGVNAPNQDFVVNLGLGDDTLDLGIYGLAATLIGVEHVTGSAYSSNFGSNFLFLANTVDGLSVDFGAGSFDHVKLATGTNSLSLTGVELVESSDFSFAGENDTLTLLNTQSGLSIDLQRGDENTVNLAEGNNSVSLSGVQTVNGSASDDSLTILNGFGAATIDLGAGTDTLNLSATSFDLTINNVEYVNGSAGNDSFVIGATTGSTTITGGMGGDFITAGAGQDIIRFTSASESPAGGILDSVNNFDTATDRITLDHVAGLATEVQFVSDGALTGSAADRHSDARLSGNLLEIDVDGDGQIGAGDIQLFLNDLNGTLNDANFITSGVNHAPTNIALGGSLSVAENSAAGAVVGALSATDPDAGDSATFSLVNPDGMFAINGSNLVVAGAIDYEAGATQEVTVRVTDAGGLSYDKTFTITVTDSNDAPAVTSGATGTVAEDAATSTVVYQATASDPDATAPGNTISWSLTGTDAGAFSIDSSGQVRLNNSADYEAKSSYSINVVATDGGNLSASQAVTVTVTDVNDAPAVTSGATGSVGENAATSAVVYQATATDADTAAPNNSITWSLAGADAGAFSIDSNGQVTLNNSADYEAKSSYSISVVATDGGNLSAIQAVTISVTDVNEGPTVTSGATASVAENAAASTVVYQAAASDPDTAAPNNTITWSLSGADAGTFSIDSSGQVRLNSSANYETKSVYNINVIATDGGNLSSLNSVVVSVADVNEAPTDISVSNANVPQSTANGTVIGALSALDPDAGDSVTFSLVDGAGGQFNVVGGNIVVAGPLTAGAQQVTVRATDALGLTFDKLLTINVNAGATVVGTVGNDILNGTAGNDSIQGLDGNDVLQGLAGDDMLEGGLGFDRAVYSDATGAVTVNLATGTVSGAGAGTDTLVNIEGAVGSDFADTFDAAGFGGSSGSPTTATGQNEFEGRGGDDLLIGTVNALGQAMTRTSYLSATSAVTVDLAAGTADGDVSVGHDTLSNVNSIVGSNHNDTFYGGDNANFTYETYEGRGGDDFIDGRGGFDQVNYQNDPATASGIAVLLAAGTVTGDATVGTDTIRNVEAARGTAFNDVFDATGYGLAGALNVSTTNGSFNDFGGGGGNDTIIGNGSTRLNYQIAAASVSVDLETNAGSAITVAGSATGATEGTDTFTGVNAAQGSMFGDTLLGSSFNNTLIGLGGDDYIDGRGGFDTTGYNSLSTVTSGVTVNMAAGTATGDASIGADTLRSIEGVQGTMLADSYDATGYGQAGALNIGNNGNFNQFEGLGGDDNITGNGNTRIIYSSATLSGVTINLQAGTASGTTVGDDTFVGVNSATGSGFNDVYNASGFTGVTSAGSFGTFNLFEGLAGNDSITGNGNTRISYSQSAAAVTVTFTAPGVGTATGAAIGTDTITAGVNSVAGSNSADNFTGSSADETFFGGGGNDIINAGGGNDGITGQGGSDNIDGGAGTDMVSFNGAQSQYTVTGSGTITVVNNGNANGDGTDTLTNVEVLQFGNAIVLLSAGTAGSPTDISTQQFTNASSAISGTTGDDYVRVGSNIFGRQLNLGAGTDTVILNAAAFGTFFALSLNGVENVTGGNADESVGLTNNAAGLNIDLGDGINDTLNLAGGTNSLSISGVENVFGSDFGPSPAVNDVLNLQNQVSGINISLGNGDNTMNLAAGANSFTNIFDIHHINGTVSDDVLAVTDSISAANGTTIDLGAGDDAIVVGGAFVTFAAIGIEHIAGSTSDNSLSLTDTVSDIAINLGAGNDTVSLANGANSLSIVGVETLSASDFTGGLNPSDDTVTLQNAVSGLTVNLGEGTANVLNLAEGVNSFDNLWNVNLLNGSSGDDTLTIEGSPANVIDLGGGNDNVIFNSSMFDIMVTNAENINASASFDRITIGNTSGSTTITAGVGADEITASGGIDNFRFASVADSAAGSADTIHDFDATRDSFTFDGISAAGDHIEYVDSGALLGSGQASARLESLGAGNDLLQVDIDGDGASDVEINLQNFSGNLSNSNFLLA